MKKLLIALGLLLVSAIPAFGQNSTTVSGTVVDTSSQAWFAGNVTFTLIPAPNTVLSQYTWAGGAFNPGAAIVCPTTTGGAYSCSVPSNNTMVPAGSRWLLTANSGTTSLVTATNLVSIGGSTQTVNFTPPPIVINAGPNAVAYADSEVSAGVGQTYYNITLTSLRLCTASTGGVCSAWSAGSGGIATGAVIAGNQNATYLSPACPTPYVSGNCFPVNANAHTVADAGWASSSQTVTTTAGDIPFACPGSVYPCSTSGAGSDVGKIVFGTANCSYGNPSQCTYNLPQGTITTVNNAHSITISSTSTGSCTYAAGSNGCELVWGFDDTTNLTAAWAAVVASANLGSGTLYLPCGNMLVQGALFVSSNVNLPWPVSIIGCGTSTMIIPTPNFSYAGCLSSGGCIYDVRSNSGQSAWNTGLYNQLSYFQVWGAGVNQSVATSGLAAMRFGPFTNVTNVTVSAWNWSYSVNPFPGFLIPVGGVTITGGGTFGGGDPACEITSASNTTVSLNGITCGAGGSVHQDLVVNYVGGGMVVSNGSYYYGLAGDSVEIDGTGTGAFTSLGDYVNGYKVTAGTLYVDGSNALSGSYNFQISGGAVHLHDVTGVNSGTGITATAGTVYDECGNTLSGTQSFTGTAKLFGSCSITGVAVTAAKLVLSSGWGSTAAVTALQGGTAPIQFTITNSGTGQGASPTITYTFPTPFWQSPISCTAVQVGGNNAIGTFASSALSATGVTFTFSLTPTASDTEIVQVQCLNP